MRILAHGIEGVFVPTIAVDGYFYAIIYLVPSARGAERLMDTRHESMVV